MAEPLWSDESFHKKELAKWNAPKRAGGHNANGFEMYPRMLYKAHPHPFNGKYEVALASDIISADKTVVLLSAEQFNNQCQKVVGNDQEYDLAFSDGWRNSQKDALAFHEGLQNDIARAAAERAYEDRNMSPAAQREIAAAVAEAGGEHVAEVKERPRRGRPRKNQQPAA